MTELKCKNLTCRYSELKEHFGLPFDPAAELDDRTCDYIRAVTILLHAELEAYLEEIARSIVEEAKDIWVRDGLANGHAAYLVAWAFGKKNKPSTPGDPVKEACNKFIKAIDDNHGIKQENIENLFKPLGFSITDFDNTLLADMSTLGSRRGALAHSSKVGIQRESSWSEIDRLINNILCGLEDFERTLQSGISQTNRLKGSLSTVPNMRPESGS